MVERHAWHLWPSRLWPASPAEERALIARWRATTTPTVSPTRSAVTLLMVALRAGATADELAELAPAVTPADLLGAYDELSIRRRRSVTALNRLLDHPDRVRDTTISSASRIAPEIVHRVTTHPGCLDQVVADVRADIAAAGTEAASVEAQLARVDRSDTSGTTLGRRLFDPYRSALWGSPSFIPTRVTQLTPGRVAALLGEETT